MTAQVLTTIYVFGIPAFAILLSYLARHEPVEHQMVAAVLSFIWPPALVLGALGAFCIYISDRRHRSAQRLARVIIVIRKA